VAHRRRVFMRLVVRWLVIGKRRRFVHWRLSPWLRVRVWPASPCSAMLAAAGRHRIKPPGPWGGRLAISVGFSPVGGLARHAGFSLRAGLRLIKARRSGTVNERVEPRLERGKRLRLAVSDDVRSLSCDSPLLSRQFRTLRVARGAGAGRVA
jgi:hypothetical protein